VQNESERDFRANSVFVIYSFLLAPLIKFPLHESFEVGIGNRKSKTNKKKNQNNNNNKKAPLFLVVCGEQIMRTL
jgi:hypothetical protein